MDLTLAGPLAAGLGALLGWLIARRGYQLNAAGAVAEWRRDLRTWADEAIDALAAPAYFTLSNGKNGATEIGACRQRLSALIDQGRLLLPNEKEEIVGTRKASAYRGLRHPCLDPLVAAEKILGEKMAIGDLPDQKTALIWIRREFVSTIQAIIDPRAVNREIDRLARSSFKKRKSDPSFGGLLPDPNSVPPGAEGLLRIVSLRYWEEHKGRPRPQP
ncbi:MAG TPA: hypothetical protein VJ860_12640 [Polyangia bacterium]|jgi:hypothetical protein|nr:hypothetical protein [Polyangia bacterium]